MAPESWGCHNTVVTGCTTVPGRTHCFWHSILHPHLLTSGNTSWSYRIPQVNIDHLNPKTLFSGFSLPNVPVARQCGHVAYDGDVYNFTSLAMQLTHGKLLKTAEWGEWQQSEFTILDLQSSRSIWDNGESGEQ